RMKQCGRRLVTMRAKRRCRRVGVVRPNQSISLPRRVQYCATYARKIRRPAASENERGAQVKVSKTLGLSKSDKVEGAKNDPSDLYPQQIKRCFLRNAQPPSLWAFAMQTISSG